MLLSGSDPLPPSQGKRGRWGVGACLVPKGRGRGGRLSRSLPGAGFSSSWGGGLVPLLQGLSEAINNRLRTGTDKGNPTV